MTKALAEVLSHDEGVGTLRRIDMQQDEPLVMVEVIDSSPEPDGTFKHYWLRVPPNTTTAREAVARDYAPAVET